SGQTLVQLERRELGNQWQRTHIQGSTHRPSSVMVTMEHQERSSNKRRWGRSPMGEGAHHLPLAASLKSHSLIQDPPYYQHTVDRKIHAISEKWCEKIQGVRLP